MFSSCYTYKLNIATANQAHSFIRHLRVPQKNLKRNGPNVNLELVVRSDEQNE